MIHNFRKNYFGYFRFYYSVVGNKLLLADTAAAVECITLLEAVPELLDAALIPFEFDRTDNARLVAACELVLEGLYAQNKISRNEEGGYSAVTKARKDRRARWELTARRRFRRPEARKRSAGRRRALHARHGASARNRQRSRSRSRGRT